MDETTTDVAIVGGGIAGGALAVRLARAGLRVTVLERSLEFRDRVRGETMFPWGCAELMESDLLDIAMRAEGTVAPRVVPYGDSMSPHAAEAAAMDTTAVVPGAAGMLNLSHPGACRELTEAATDGGAEVVRGARRVRVTAGPRTFAVGLARWLRPPRTCLIGIRNWSSLYPMMWRIWWA
jgi:flavin-dependent dehydrogenase